MLLSIPNFDAIATGGSGPSQSSPVPGAVRGGRQATNAAPAAPRVMEPVSQQGSRFSTDRDSQSVSAVSLPAGVLDLVTRHRVALSLATTPQPITVPGSVVGVKWTPPSRPPQGGSFHELVRQTEYHGFATHREGDNGSTSFGGGGAGGPFYHFTDYTEERIITPALFEAMVHSVGLVVEDLVGDIDGAPFIGTSLYGQQCSERRVYVLRRAH